MIRKLSLAVLLLALTACGSAASTGNDSTGGAPSVAASSASSAAPQTSVPAANASPAASIGNISGDFNNGSAAAETTIGTRAIAALASQVNLPADTLKLVNTEQTEWSDGSLGCPQEGMMYTQALVPGFKLTYNDGSRDYQVHTDTNGERAVWCDNGQPKEITQP
jgi:hypothetical protein